MVGTAAAQDDRSANDTEEADVTVGISSTIAVDIQPANLNYDNAVVGNRNTSSNRGFGAIEIDNTGSEYINRIWLNNSVPTEDPFGTGSANAYDAGNFLEVRPKDELSGVSGTWYPVNKKTYLSSGTDTSGSGFAETNIPSFIQAPSSYGQVEVGEIRRGNETIYFVVQGDSNSCDGSNSQTVRVGNVSATDSRLGTVDFTRDSTEYGFVEYTLTEVSGNNYGIAQTNNDGFSGVSGVGLNWTYSTEDVQETDLLTKCDDTSEQPNAFVNKYNVNVAGADDLPNGAGSATGYLMDVAPGGTESTMLAPGEKATVQTAINVPEGVAQGSVSPGNLRVLVTADTTAETDPDS